MFTSGECCPEWVSSQRVNPTSTSSTVRGKCIWSTRASSTWSSGTSGARSADLRTPRAQIASGLYNVPTHMRIMHHRHRGGTDETRHHWMWQEQGLGQEPQCWTAEGQRCIHWPIFWDQQAVR